MTVPRFYINEDISIDIRYASANARTCDIKYFTVWCQNTQMHLTTIEIPDTTFVSDHYNDSYRNINNCTLYDDSNTSIIGTN